MLRRRVGVEPFAALAQAGSVPRLDPVHVPGVGCNILVHILRRRASRVVQMHQKYAQRVQRLVPPQYLVACDALIPRVVPAKRHRIMAHRSGQASGYGRRLLGLRIPGRDGCGRSAGQGFVGALVVGKGHTDFDRLVLVGGDQRICGACRILYIRVRGCVIGNPLVAVGNVGQPVGVGNARSVRAQRFTHLGSAADCRRSRGRAVGCLWLDSKANRLRCRTDQGLLVGLVIREGHPNLDGLALVVGLECVGGTSSPR